MLEGGDDTRLPKKPLHGLDVGLGTYGMNLQGDLALEDRIESAVNHPHPAFADPAKNLVLADFFHGPSTSVASVKRRGEANQTRDRARSQMAPTGPLVLEPVNPVGKVRGHFLVLARRSDDFISRYSEEEQRSQRRKGPGIYRQD